MPTYGFAHARNGQGCRQIEATNATVLPRGWIFFSRGWVRLSRERQNRPYTCTLHITLSIVWKHTLELCIVKRHRAASIFAPCLFFFVIRRLFVCGGSDLAAILTATSNKQQHSLRNIFAVTHWRRAWPFDVIYLFPSRLLDLSAGLLILLTSHRIRKPQSSCIFPGELI